VAARGSARYEFIEHTEDPGVAEPIAIVGGGIAGLRCARLLDERGVDVVVLDKARAPGGRMATRRTDGVSFDHGAQYFTARHPEFVEQVRAWRREGVVDEWAGRIVSLSSGRATPGRGSARRFVGMPGMSAVTRRLARGLEFEPDFRVDSLERSAAGWTLGAEDGRRTGPFATVILAVPAPQAAPLLAAAPALAGRAAGVAFAPCQALMVRYPRSLGLPFDGAFVEAEALSWVARNSSKPARGPGEECWVLHGSPEWSRRRLDTNPGRVTAEMLEAFDRACGARLPEPSRTVLHRWRFALPIEPLADPCLFDPAWGLGACGDWCAGPRVEGAFLSGSAMARRLLGA